MSTTHRYLQAETIISSTGEESEDNINYFEPMPSYYDIDTILAEEELLVVKPSFDFSLLAHLDPDSSHQLRRSRKRPRGGDDEADNDDDGSNSDGLPEGTKIKMPLWAVERWALLGFIRFPSLPRHYGRKMKERLEADPISVDLR